LRKEEGRFDDTVYTPQNNKIYEINTFYAEMLSFFNFSWSLDSNLPTQALSVAYMALRSVTIGSSQCRKAKFSNTTF